MSTPSQQRTPPRKKKSRGGGNSGGNASPQESKSARRRRKKREAAKRRDNSAKANDSGGSSSSPNRNRKAKATKATTAKVPAPSSPTRAANIRAVQRQAGAEQQRRVAAGKRVTAQEQMVRNANVTSAKKAANEEQQRRVAQGNRTRAHEQMTRQANVTSAKKAANEEQQRRVAQGNRTRAHEQITRQASVRRARSASEAERARRVAEDQRLAALEQLLRVSNQTQAKQEQAEEQARRVKEEGDGEAQARVRRRSLTLQSEIMAGARALQAGSLSGKLLESKSSWRAPKTPRTQRAENLRARRLSMQGFPSLGGSPAAASSKHEDGNETTSRLPKPTKAEEVAMPATGAPTSAAQETMPPSTGEYDAAEAAAADDDDTAAADNAAADNAVASAASDDVVSDSSATDAAAQKLAQFKEYKTLRKSANALKTKSDFVQALELYAKALGKIKVFPKDYHQERADTLKRSAICFIGAKQYDQALEAVRSAHREVAKMPNGEATTELLRWNLTYQMTRGLQKKSKFTRSSNLATALLPEIKKRIAKAAADGKPWSDGEVQKANTLSTALVKAIAQNKSMAAKEKKPQGQYFDGAASGFGKGGLFTNSGDNTKGSGDSKVSEAAVPRAKAKNSDTPVSTTKTTAGTPALAASNLTKEKKRRSKDSEEKEEDYDDSSFWLLTAGAALLVAGIAVFTLMRSK